VLAAQASTGQAKNPVWAWIRYGRLTGSRIGEVLKIMSKANSAPSEKFLYNLLVHKRLDGVKSVQWGRQHGATAIKAYSEATGKTVVSTGVWLHEEGFSEHHRMVWWMRTRS